MMHEKSYFLCGIGGSGMLPLALILKGRGAKVAGSDRSLDQGRTPEKFAFLREQGITLFPQDGSGVSSPDMLVVTSAAVEETVPDVMAARHLGARLVRRADLLAELFNAAPHSVAVGGTSGKSTTTGMIGWMLAALGRDPTIMNGAVMKNFTGPENAFASAVVGKSGLFVSEVDESDGSIALYRPKIAVLNNVALDHKSMEELRSLFGAFIGKAQVAVLNRDNAETATLASHLPPEIALTFSLTHPSAHLYADALEPTSGGIGLFVRERGGRRLRVQLQVPGRHNVANALAALGAVGALGVPLGDAAEALSRFTGIRRRLEVTGTAGGVTVIDDFAHNPDKILATMATLHDFPGRLLVMFQPHGFGPLKLMKDAFIETFAQALRTEDVLLMPDPVYYGGTVERSVTSADIVTGIEAAGRTAFSYETRAECGSALLKLARPGDRIVIMGARDDTLSQFAAELVAALG